MRYRSSRAAGAFPTLTRGECSLAGSSSRAAAPRPPVQSWAAHHSSPSAAQPGAKPEEEPGQNRWCLLVSFGKVLQGQPLHRDSSCPRLLLRRWAGNPPHNDGEHGDPLPSLLSPPCHPPSGPQKAEESGTSRDTSAGTVTAPLHPGWDGYLLPFFFNTLGRARGEFISFTGASFGLS